MMPSNWRLKINKTIRSWLYRFRCPLTERYIQYLLKRQGITAVVNSQGSPISLYVE